VCYTAGNAGASLARLVYAANRHLAYKDRMTVFCLVDHLVPDNIRSVLRALGCVVAELPTTERYVLDWQTITDLAAEAAGTEAVEVLRTGSWHVTDGWDGVGAIMYRLMFSQVIQQLKIDHVVVPAGTGNLLLGAYLGLGDCGTGLKAVKLWAALPPGENIEENVMKGVIPDAKRGDADHFAPKLVGRYTPLAPCVRHIINNGARFLRVDANGMRDAGKATVGGRAGHAVAAEPSALVAFAALKLLNQELRQTAASPAHRPFHCDDAVLVVNSGLGLLGPSEAEFIGQAASAR
jgi:threonine dehydratase